MKSTFILAVLLIGLVMNAKVENQGLQDQKLNIYEKVGKLKEELEMTPADKLEKARFDKYTEGFKERVIQNSSYLAKQSGLEQENEDFTEQSRTIKPRKSLSLLSMTRTISKSDSPDSFFNGPVYQKNINLIPQSGRVRVTPWSNSYFPIKNGLLSVRYQRNSKNTIGVVNPNGPGFLKYYNWYQSVHKYGQPAEHNSYSTSAKYQKYVNDNYSASEKYDLLVGDYDFTLTNQSKAYGRQFSDSNGNVAAWMGICHGWSPASYMYPRPVSPVTVRAADGVTKITFLPDDIRGLASLWWANAKYHTNFVGDKCNRCHNVNPASLILTFANYIGFKSKNLSFDPEADYEVWNQPVRSYKFTYFNPITKKEYASPKSARIPMKNFASSSSRFLRSAYRNKAPDAVYGVGAILDIEYTFENQLKHDYRSNPDETKDGKFRAIIELDFDEKIVGGEWMQYKHPNFIWEPNRSKPIKNTYDGMVFWNGSSASLRKLTPTAKKASAKGEVLKTIVDLLVKYS